MATVSYVLAAAGIGSKAFWLLYLSLGSAWAASSLSNRKGYGEKVGLGTGLLLSAIGVLIWLVIPAKATSIASQRKARKAKDAAAEKPAQG
jgi:hypothetical protein